MVVVQCGFLKAMLKKYINTETGRAAYIHVLHVLETGRYGSGWLSTCINDISSTTLSGKQDPTTLFDDMRSNGIRFNRMSSFDPFGHVVMSSIDVCASKDKCNSW